MVKIYYHYKIEIDAVFVYTRGFYYKDNPLVYKQKTFTY